MSASYGKVRLRDGRLLNVEAYGATGCIKLEWPLGEVIAEFDDPDQLMFFITALENAYGHCWSRR